MTTEPRILLNLADTDLKRQVTPSSSARQAFSDLADLTSGAVYEYQYATFEPDFWLLDGTYHFAPTVGSGHAGFVSSAQSDASGAFGTAPTVTLTFDTGVTLPALTLVFSPHTGDYITQVTIIYRYAGAVVLGVVLAPDGPTVTAPAVEGLVDEVAITLHATSEPYRYARLSEIIFGDELVFRGESVRAAELVEECNPLSDELRVNTLNLRLHSPDDAFNPLNPDGLYDDLREGMPLTVQVVRDGVRELIGRFFLQAWRHTSDRQIELDCVDWIGLLDQMPAPRIPYNITLTTLGEGLAFFLGGAGVPYEVDPTLAGTLIPKLPYVAPHQSLREVLQQIAFVAGAAVDCSRSTVVRVYPTPIAADEDAVTTLTRSEKGIDQALELKPALDAVELEYTQFSGLVPEVLVDETLTAGLHERTFDKVIAQSYTTSGTATFTLVDPGPYSLLINVTAPGTVKVEGFSWPEVAGILRVNNPAPGAFPRFTLQAACRPLVFGSVVTPLSQRLYAYYTQRYVLRLRLIAPTVQVGQVVAVETLYGQTVRGVIEKMSMDLAGGMVADVEVRGVLA